MVLSWVSCYADIKFLFRFPVPVLTYSNNASIRKAPLQTNRMYSIEYSLKVHLFRIGKKILHWIISCFPCSVNLHQIKTLRMILLFFAGCVGARFALSFPRWRIIFLRPKKEWNEQLKNYLSLDNCLNISSLYNYGCYNARERLATTSKRGGAQNGGQELSTTPILMLLNLKQHAIFLKARRQKYIFSFKPFVWLELGLKEANLSVLLESTTVVRLL